jgi:multiple sugar transport system ATP-binding protein
MSDGELQQIGTPEEIYERPANLFVADFVGEPPMNFLPCDPVHADGGLMLHAAPMTIGAPARLRGALGNHRTPGDLLLGVRPVDIHLTWTPHPEAVGTGTVRLVENLGDEQIVAVDVGPGSVESVVSASEPARIGDTVWLLIESERVHVFDRATGRSLAA